MSKLRTDSIEPRVGSGVDFGGLDIPSFHGVPLAPTVSPVFTGTPTAPTQADTDISTAVATTAFARTRAANAVTERLSNVAPLMDGASTAGSSVDAARVDHRHPTDTSRASATEVANHVAASFLLTVPGLYTNIFTAPQNGWAKLVVVGGGGGGGGGGSDLAGQNGGAGVAQSFSIGINAGDTVTLQVGFGGAGATSGGFPSSPPSAFDGGASLFKLNGVTLVNSLGGTRGFSVNSSTLTGPVKTIKYHVNDFGDFAGARVAINAPAANTPSSKGGHEPMAPGTPNAVPDGGDLSEFALAGNPAAMNGGDGVFGGAGGGGAPTRVFLPARGFHADPVHGEGGSGSPTSFGGNGGNGFTYFEFHSTGSTVVGSIPSQSGVNYASLDFLKQELIAQGLSITV